MRRLSCWIPAVVLALAAVGTDSVAQYGIVRGAANYVNGAPVAGASVSLAVSGISTQTDSNGTFYLSYPLATVDLPGAERHDAPRLSRDRLLFHVRHPGTSVRVQFLDLGGRVASSMDFTCLQQGEYAVPTGPGGVANRLCLVSVMVGEQEWVLRLVPAGGRVCAGSGRTSPHGVGYLSRAAAVLDTVVAIAADGARRSEVIDTSVATVFFTFDNPASGGDPSDAALSAMLLTVPLVQQVCYRYCTYVTVLHEVAPVPPFDPDTQVYSATPDSSIVVGLRPIARSVASSVAVVLDSLAIQPTLWFTGTFPTAGVLGAFYTCTLSAPGETRTFVTTVTGGDSVTERVYTAVVSHN